jgi:hypothetical protein
MPASRSRPLCILLLSLTLLGSSGCSRIGLAYRNLDLLIPFALGDYLSLNGQQQQLLDDQLAVFLRWHCTQELPRYGAWLGATQELLKQPEIDPARLEAQLQQVRQAGDTLAQHLTAPTLAVLRSLDEDQVQALGKALQQDISKRRKTYLQPSLERQIAQRAQRMEKRLSAGYGRLNSAQKQQIGNWSAARGGENQQWIDNRRHWQARFMAALAQRQAPEFEPRIAELLQNRREHWTPAYRKTFAQAEIDLRQLLLQVHRQSDGEQRRRLHNRLGALRTELAQVQCET